MGFRLNDEFVSRTGEFSSWGKGESLVKNGSVTLPATMVSKFQSSQQNELQPITITNIDQHKQQGAMQQTQAIPAKTDYIELLKKYWYIPVALIGGYILLK